MIKTLHHIAIIVSSEKSVSFYKELGFVEKSREIRPKDILIWMEGFGTVLELFIAPDHPERLTNPEANGLRHIAFIVDNLEETRAALMKFNPEPIKEPYHIFFVKDPDGLPLEFRES